MDVNDTVITFLDVDFMLKPIIELYCGIRLLRYKFKLIYYKKAPTVKALLFKSNRDSEHLLLIVLNSRASLASITYNAITLVHFLF